MTKLKKVGNYNNNGVTDNNNNKNNNNIIFELQLKMDILNSIKLLNASV